jgi:hypothetical protein
LYQSLTKFAAVKSQDGRKQMMADGWYIEVYSHGSQRPREHMTLPDFASALSYVKKFNEAKATDILRILSPASATNQERRELMENGATLG